MNKIKDDWVAMRVHDALKAAPVPIEVAFALGAELSGTMSERPLRPAELSDVARNLLAQSAKSAGGKEGGL